MSKTFLEHLSSVQKKEWSSKEASEYCWDLCRSHYENFSVGTFLLPRKLRRHLAHIYSFCRWADDLGDEVGNPQRSLELLEWWEGELSACFQGRASHPVFLALMGTVEEFHLPLGPFQDLIKAFKMDQTVTRYETFQDLLGYCSCSANPVGRLFLALFGYTDPERQSLSDLTCTALQLANFWQDIAIDLEKGRIYLPGEEMGQYGYSERDLLSRTCNTAFQKLMAFQVRRTREWFHRGLPLIPMLSKAARVDVEMFSRGGLRILEKIEEVGYDLFTRRPALSKGEKLSFLLRRVLSGWIQRGTG